MPRDLVMVDRGTIQCTVCMSVLPMLLYVIVRVLASCNCKAKHSLVAMFEALTFN